jgi:hypothetical protein
VNALVIMQPKTVIIALSGATQRQDGAGSLPDRIRGIAVQKLATSLMDKGFVREIRAKPGMPAWRRDDDGRTYALVIADPTRRSERLGQRAMILIGGRRANARKYRNYCGDRGN